MSLLAGHLNHIVQTMPYNNVEPLFQRIGRETLKFGGSCVQQQRELAALIRKNGHRKVQHLVADQTNHTVSIVRDGSMIDVLDTSFRMVEPAVLDDKFHNERAQTRAYPTTGEMSHVVRFERRKELIKEQLIVSIENREEVVLKTELLRLDRATEQLPDLETDIDTIRKEGSILIMAVVAGNVVQLRVQTDGTMSLKPSNGPRIRPSSPERFYPLFDAIAAINGGTRDQLHGYLDEGMSMLTQELAA